MEVRVGQGGQTNYDIISRDNSDLGSAESIAGSGSVAPDSQAAADSNGIDNAVGKQKSISEADVKKAVDKLNKFIDDENTHVVYEQHDKFKNTFIVKIVDNSTGQVIQEIPPKKLLDMVAKMCEMVGVLFDKKA